MTNKILGLIIVAASFLYSYGVRASVVGEYATNSYNDHVLSRSEKKCMDEGYQVTYATCTDKTAPADRCPHHDSYYRTCSQEQWCRNNNYTFLPEDCELPSYPLKVCDNDFKIYRACQKDEQKACREKGFVSATECTLSDKRCEFDNNYGKCCDECPDFPYMLKSIPDGYVSNGEVCTTCGGVVKTQVKEASCDGFSACEYGPASKDTGFCKQGKKVLYSSCKTSEALCKEKGFIKNSCEASEDEENCPEFAELKKCNLNCYKYAVAHFTKSDIIQDNVENPELDGEKTELRSLYGQILPECTSSNIPTVVLNINSNTLPIYRTLFNRDIKNINFVVNFEEPLTLEANGKLENVRIKIKGAPAECSFSGKGVKISGKVSISGEGNFCANVNIADMSKFTVTKSIVGNVKMGSNVQLGVKGDVKGFIQSSAYSEILVKGQVYYKNQHNNPVYSEGISFGCNNKVKVDGGIKVETANILIRQYALIDTPSIDMISTGTSDAGTSSIHVYKYAKITSILGDSEYMLTDNISDSSGNCDDKYIEHKASSLDGQGNVLSLNTADSLEGKWQCKSLSKLQMRCN